MILQDSTGEPIVADSEYDDPILTYHSEEDMKSILVEISEIAIAEKEIDFPESMKKNGWLGTEIGAADEEITKAEERLDVKFPADYVEFMKLTNGFHAMSDIDPTFFPIDQVEFYRNYDPVGFAIWSSDTYIGDELSRSIIVADRFGEQQFLLIPPLDEKGIWGYWEFAEWIPGEQPYGDLKSYFIGARDLIRSY